MAAKPKPKGISVTLLSGEEVTIYESISAMAEHKEILQPEDTKETFCYTVVKTETFEIKVKERKEKIESQF